MFNVLKTKHQESLKKVKDFLKERREEVEKFKDSLSENEKKEILLVKSEIENYEELETKIKEVDELIKIIEENTLNVLEAEIGSLKEELAEEKKKIRG